MSNAERAMTDAELLSVAKTVESADFERIEPPAEVWTGLLAEVRKSQPAGATADIMIEPADSGTGAMWQLKLLRVAAALVLVGGIGAVLFSQRSADPEAVILATAAMSDEGLPVATDSQAWASVVCEGDDCRVDVEFTTVPEPGAAVLELWVIDADVADMHSLGVVTGSGSFALPAGVSPDGFPIVDISVEPRDGVAAHSGQSVLRGTFETSA